MKVNQKYIAERLKVSRVTVTKALLDHPDISIETRKKVKAMADELGYIPNIVGRSLSTQKTGTIGIIVPKIDHSFFSKAIESMYAGATELGYQIILMVSFENEETEKNDIKTLLSMNVDGIVIDTTAQKNHGGFDLIYKHKVPVLFFDRKLVGVQDPGVFFDDFNLSYQLTKAVLGRGYRQSGYITGPKQINISQERLNGFKKAIEEHRLEVSKNHICISELTEAAGYYSMMSLHKKLDVLPEVLFCVNDSVALGVYRACKELKIRIPEDLGVVGFGDLKISELMDPPLTTVKLPVEQAGKTVIQRLVSMIKENATFESELLPGELLLRDSIKSAVNKPSRKKKK